MQLKLLRFFFMLASLFAPSAAARIGVSVFYGPRRFMPARWESEALAAGQCTSLLFDGELLDVTVWGQRGPAVLLVHGWEGRRSQMGKLAVALANKGYRVIAFDGPAHGSSLKKRTTLVEFSEAIEAAATSFGPLHAIVGHSFGSAAAAIAVRKGLTVDCLVLISCPYSLKNVVGNFARMVGIPDRAHQKMYPIMGKLHGCPETDLSFETIGPDLKVRCLLVHDLKDKYIPPEDGVRAHSVISNAKMFQTQGLGHMRILQDAGVVSKVVAFVDRSECAASALPT